jgi:hypothetical protein
MIVYVLQTDGFSQNQERKGDIKCPSILFKLPMLGKD